MSLIRLLGLTLLLSLSSLALAGVDGDGVPDNIDALLNDPAASVDTDGNGKPDEWNDGKSAAESTSDPALALVEDDDNHVVNDEDDAYSLIMDGLNWFQSDAVISSGNSGGPLIDDLRAVVAISTAGFAPGGGQVCQNFFVRIGEALIVMGQSIKEALKASIFKDFGAGSSKV